MVLRSVHEFYKKLNEGMKSILDPTGIQIGSKDRIILSDHNISWFFDTVNCIPFFSDGAVRKSQPVVKKQPEEGSETKDGGRIDDSYVPMQNG